MRSVRISGFSGFIHREFAESLETRSMRANPLLTTITPEHVRSDVGTDETVRSDSSHAESEVLF